MTTTGDTIMSHRYSLLPAVGVCLAMTVAGGCTMKSADVLRQIDAIDAQKRSGDFLKMVTSVARFHNLADRIDEQTEDVVTQAYMQAETDEQRRSVVRIAAMNADGSGRYVPLLCYVVQSEADPRLRLAAAGGFARLKQLNRVIRRSPIVLMLGDLAEGEETPHEKERLLYFLEEFLLNVCKYPIPGAERIESPMPLDASGKPTWHVVRSEPTVVSEWWRGTGRSMALAMAFDQPPDLKRAAEVSE